MPDRPPGVSGVSRDAPETPGFPPEPGQATHLAAVARAFGWLALAWLLLHFAAVALADQVENSAPPSPIPLTPEERAWLDEGHRVRVRITDWPPYMFTQPVPSGVVVDYLQAIARRFNFQVEFVPSSIQWAEAMADVRGPRAHFDLLPTMNRTPERNQGFALTDDYLTAPWVVYTRNDTPYIAGLESLSGLLVAAEKGYAMTDKIRADFPAIRILEVGRSSQALEAVATGQADAYVGNLAIANFLIKQNRFTNLVVAAPTPYGQHTQAMGIRKDWGALASLIDRGLAAMSHAEVNAINQKWGAVEVRPQSDYRLVWQTVAGATLVLVVFFLWNRRLAREVAVRQRIAGDLMRSEALLTEEKRHLEQAQQAFQHLNQTWRSRLGNARRSWHPSMPSTRPYCSTPRWRWSSIRDGDPA
jgi:two-component system sensor histidine kinase/response regulator